MLVLSGRVIRNVRIVSFGASPSEMLQEEKKKTLRWVFEAV